MWINVCPSCFLREEKGRMKKVSHRVLNFRPNSPSPSPLLGQASTPGTSLTVLPGCVQRYADGQHKTCSEGQIGRVLNARLRALNLKPWVMGSHAGTCPLGCLRASSY